MSVIALRQLRLGSLKQVYKLDTAELCATVQDAGKRKIADKQLWDALLYRASLLRGDFRPLDLALTADALGKVRHSDPGFMEYLLQEVRLKARKFHVSDVALLLNSFAKLAVRDEVLTTESLMPALLRRIRESTRPENLALLALSYTRLGDPGREPIFDRIVASLTPRMERIKDGHTLSLLACAFALPARSDAATADAFFSLDELLLRETGDAHLPHEAFLEVLLKQCEQDIFCFRSIDVLHLCFALSSLVRRGREGLLPPRLMKRLQARLGQLRFECLPVQLARLLEVFGHLPDVEAKCVAKLLDEAAYRIRDVSPNSCLPILRTISRVGGHPRAYAAVSWRLTHSDAASMLSAEEVGEVASIFASLRPRLWESREALLLLLQGMAARRLVPEPNVLVKLLRPYAELAVRDTHWFHLHAKLRAPGELKPESSKQQGAALSTSDPLNEEAIADAALALAQLNLAQLVDEARLFSRAAVAVVSPGPAVAALEAASIFDLVHRRPNDCSGANLEHFMAALSRGPAEALREEVKMRRLRLFPFTGLAASCSPEVLRNWEAAVAESLAEERHDAPQEGFEPAVLEELSRWSNVELITSITVGPVRVPVAASLVDLARHLEEHPLKGAEEPLPAAEGQGEEPTTEDDEAQEEEDAAPGDGGGGGRRSRQAARRAAGAGAPAMGPPAGRSPLPVGQGFPAGPGVLPCASTNGKVPSKESHVLFQLLHNSDFYHASARLRGERQREKRLVLGAQRFAEVTLLKRAGWQVCCIPEHLWSRDGRKAAAEANKELVYRLVANLSPAN